MALQHTIVLPVLLALCEDIYREQDSRFRLRGGQLVGHIFSALATLTHWKEARQAMSDLVTGRSKIDFVT